MGITLEQEAVGGSPVVKRAKIGETFYGAIVFYEWRQIVKDGEAQYKDNGKPRNEMVVELLAVEGDMEASLAGVGGNPQPGDTVRTILRGGAAGQWIDAVNEFKTTNGRGVEVGDILRMTTTHATRYLAQPGASSSLGDLTTQADVDAWKQSSANLDRKESIGWRGELAIGKAEGPRAEWLAKAEAAYHQRNKAGIDAGAAQSTGFDAVADTFGGGVDVSEDPF